ncbi:PREDICTED: uncharacterized protein LOC109214845 [Nicotiana attenuata]|uniref:uncharacterized protein LOC109214845 n=1 Tax=Nicotiana attenuata TaxID=49451 RepID=UPI000905C757|nr:PREDICTED: uncharacterized protein LOC109214845 [Nicotiana attenuata]
MGLDAMNQSIAKNAADGSFTDKTFARITQILDKMAKHNQAWHSVDTTGGIAYGTPSLTNMIKENQERDQVIAGLSTNVNVLTKMFTKSQSKKVNVVEDVEPTSNEDYEEGNYVNNSQGGYQRQPYQGSGQQNQWRPNPQGSNPYVPLKGQYSNSPHWKECSSSDSKLENMLERVLQNQDRSDTSMRNMTELAGSHTASIQKLEMQMRYLSREQNQKQKGTLPSDTIANPKGSGSSPTSHCMAITTRSGKILKGENEQVVDVEDSEQEVEAQVEVPVVVEAEKVPEEVKIQEVNREEVKERVKEAPKTLAPIPRPPPPFPQRLSRKVDDSKLENFNDILKQLSVNIPFVEVFQEMPVFAKYLKDFITKKKSTKNEVFARALCDNRASINLMPLAIYKQEGLGMPRPTSMRLQMADRSVKRSVRIVDDVLVKVGKFLLPTDFVILDCVVDKVIPIILGRPFLATGKALMDSARNEIKFRVNDEEVTFQASKGMKLPHAYESISVIDVVDEVEQLLNVLMEHRQAIGWTIADIRGIPAGICEHKIKLEQERKPSVEHQRRLNPSMQEVEFDFEVKDRKGTENQVVNHLSRLEEAGRPKEDLEINDAFPDEHILALSSTFAPWRCVLEDEVMPILKACHDSPVGVHHGGSRTAAKVLECGYYWPAIYQDANRMVKACDQFQR